VTCQHQTAGIFFKRELLLLLGDPAGLLRSLLHCTLRFLLRFLRHVALLMRWLNRCVHSGIEMHYLPNTPTLKKNSVPLKEVFTREHGSIRRFFANGTRNFSDSETIDARKIARGDCRYCRSSCDAALFANDAPINDRALKSAQVVETTRMGCAWTLSRDFWQ
jgi:hypothetical protein